MRKETLVVYYNSANATPIREWDYIANFDGDEEFGPFGYGKDESSAILDLLQKVIDRGYI